MHRLSCCTHAMRTTIIVSAASLELIIINIVQRFWRIAVAPRAPSLQAQSISERCHFFIATSTINLIWCENYRVLLETDNTSIKQRYYVFYCWMRFSKNKHSTHYVFFAVEPKKRIVLDASFVFFFNRSSIMNEKQFQMPTIQFSKPKKLSTLQNKTHHLRKSKPLFMIRAQLLDVCAAEKWRRTLFALCCIVGD